MEKHEKQETVSEIAMRICDEAGIPYHAGSGYPLLDGKPATGSELLDAMFGVNNDTK